MSKAPVGARGQAPNPPRAGEREGIHDHSGQGRGARTIGVEGSGGHGPPGDAAHDVPVGVGRACCVGRRRPDGTAPRPRPPKSRGTHG